MRRALALTLTALVAAATIILTGCGGGGRPRAPHPAGWGGTPKGITLPRPLLKAVPSAPMFDTVTLGTVPPNPFALAGYTSGYWPTYLPLRGRYPRAHTISIAVNASHRAACLDVEPGDASPTQAGPWARAHGPAACLYGDLSNMPAIKANLKAWLGAGWRARVRLWLAWYTFHSGLVSGYDAVQWTDKALGRNLDESTVSLDFLRGAQPPYAPPRPHPKPKPNRHAIEARIALLRGYAHRDGCYHRRKPHKCNVWALEVRALEHELRKAGR